MCKVQDYPRDFVKPRRGPFIRGVLLLAALLACLSAPASAQTLNICDRTPAVQRAILAAKNSGDCALVAAPLAFTALRITGSVAALQRGDFDGVSVTGSLTLSGIGLERLSPGVFEGIGVIRLLDMQRNNLGSLPADVFRHLQAGLCTTRIARNPLDRLPIRLLADLKRVASSSCGNTGLFYVDGIPGGAPDYLGNIRYIDADTGRVVSSSLVMTEGESRRLLVELDALPGINGGMDLRHNSVASTGRLSLQPVNLGFRFSAETTRIEVTVTGETDDNREHETVFLSWTNDSGPNLEGEGSTVMLWPFAPRRWQYITPPLPVTILEPVVIEDTNPEPNRIWRGVSSGTGVAGWAPRILVDDAASAETSYSLVSDAGGLFAIDIASGALSAHGGWPLPAARRHDLVVGADYRGAPATRTAAIEVFGALSLADGDGAQNAVTVGDAAGAQVRGIRPLVRADGAVVTSGVVWTLAGGGGLFHADTSTGAILLTQPPEDTDAGVSTVTLTASYAGAGASLPLPVVVSLPDRVYICDRSDRVRHAILESLSPAPACAAVSTAQMASITALTVTSGGASVQLRAGDFADMPNLQALDLRDNGIRVLPEHLLSGVPAAFGRFDIRGNPVTRIPAQILVDWDDSTDPGQALFVDEEDRLTGFQYRANGTTLSRLVLLEDERITTRRNFDFQVVLPDGIPRLSENTLFPHPDALNAPERAVGLLTNRLIPPTQIVGTVTVHDRSISWTPDGDFAEEEIAPRMLLWALVDDSIFYPSGGRLRQGLAVEAFPVEVRENLVLRDDNAQPNRIEAGSTGTVAGWTPRPVPSASAAVAAGLDYGYALASDAGGLFAINTANGALSLVPGQSHTPGAHDVVVMVTATGERLVRAATAQAVIEVIAGVNICDRTEAVRASILAATPETADDNRCNLVRPSQLAAITALTVTSGGSSVQLRAGDFADLPNLQVLDLRNNGIRDLPANILDDIPPRRKGGFYRLDIRNNPMTRIPPRIVAYMDTIENRRAVGHTNQLLIDEEDRLPGLEYASEAGQATTLSRLVLHEGQTSRLRVFPPAGVAAGYFLNSFELVGDVLHQGVSWTVTATSVYNREIQTNLVTIRFGVSTLTMAVSLDDNFAHERRPLRWRYRTGAVGAYLRLEPSPQLFGLFTEDFPLEVRETLALGDGNPAPNRIAAGAPAGSPVIDWRPQPAPSASSTATAALNYEYELTSNPDGLFAINTENGALSLAPGGVLPAVPSTHDAVVMVAAAGQHLVLTATAAVTVVQDADSWYICDRTPAVQRAILAAKGGNCAFVAGPLEFGALVVTGSVAALQRGDFRGVSVSNVPGLLVLRGLGLQSLSADVFEGIGVIHGLDISRNNLRSLPADVVSRLPVGLCVTHLYNNPLTRLPIRLLTGLKRVVPTSSVPLCGGEQGVGRAILVVENDYNTGQGHIPTPDYLGNIRYIDADTGRAVSSGLVVTEGEPRRIQVELDALPGVNGRLVLDDNQRAIDRLSLEPTRLAFTSFSETTRIEVVVTARADDNREHETASLHWWDESSTQYYEGTRSSVSIFVSAYDGDRSGLNIHVRTWQLRTPPLSVTILEPVGIEDTNPGPNRIWRGASSGTGVAGWAPRILVDGAVSAETSYSLLSDAGGLFAIDSASGALSAHGGWPLSSAGRHDLVVGTDYRGAPATRTVAVEVFGALSLEDADVAQNAATVGQTAGESVGGIRPLVRADGAAAAAAAGDIAWTLAGRRGLFRVDTSSGAILLTRRLADRHIGVSTVTLTASYGGAEASLPLPVAVSLPDRVNICDRTPVVQAAILAETGDAACDSVSLSRMGSIQRLTSRHFQIVSGPVETLSNLDFRRMPGLEILSLNGFGLTRLPAAIFRSSTALTMLRLHDNDNLDFLPARLLADLADLHLLRVEEQVRVGDIRYRVDGEVTTGTLVISEDQSRDVLVEAVGGLHTTMTLVFQAQGAPVAATPVEIEIGPSAAARSVRLSAVTDADIVHDRSPVAWKWQLSPPPGTTGVRRGDDRGSHIPTPNLAVRVNETIALTDTNPAASWLREDAADDVAVAGWSPQVSVDGVVVPAASVSYRLTADAGGLFEADSATGALSLADGRAPDYAVSSRHTVTVEANYDGVTAARSVTIDVLDVTDICSRTDTVENAILAATPAADACGSVLVSELEAVTALTATAAAAFVTEADFDGLPSLVHLDLIGAGAVRLPLRVVANFGRGAGFARLLRVDRRARISGLVYRDDGSGEVITPPLVLSEGATRRLRVATSGVPGRVLRFSLDGSGLHGVTATDSLELGAPSTPTLELTALTDEDFNPASGVLAWAFEPGVLRVESPDGAGFARHRLLTEGLRVDVRETDVFEDINPADNRISEAAAVNTVVAGWSPQVRVNGVRTTAVRYRLADDAGGLFAIDSATGVLSLAGELDYEASTFHAVEVAARVTDTGVTALLAAVVRVDNVPELSFGGTAAGVISEAAVAGAAVSGVAVSLLDDGVSRDDGIFYQLAGTGSEVFMLAVSGNVAGLQLANPPLDRETTPVYSLMLSGRYLGASISTRVAVHVANVVEEVALEAMPDVYQIREGVSSGTRVDVALVVKTEDDVTRTDDVTYSLTGSAAFRITTVGEIFVSGALDYEETTSHTLRITATYEGVTSDEALLTVNVEDLSLS
ncbi:MAG: hypothetical protein OXU34_03490, partial [Gammaproteobacteria bacterium]|nr:hypothetical protein [Gammaproteobacteria bacterium]